MGVICSIFHFHVQADTWRSHSGQSHRCSQGRELVKETQSDNATTCHLVPGPRAGPDGMTDLGGRVYCLLGLEGRLTRYRTR